MASEQRRFRRAPQPFQAACRPYGGLQDIWYPVITLNLSAGGIGFRSAEPYELGSSLDIRLQITGLTQPLFLRGHVMWTTALPGNVMEGGIEFAEVTLDQQAQIDALVRFLDKRPPNP